ncbi:hypothetical protein AMJ80_03905 [bacterium SM23_31]|nr:MAG: hypothetical protein AMJ80_03905 [bacterium SM23_31]
MKKEYTISTLKANIIGVPIFILALVIVWIPYRVLWNLSSRDIVTAIYNSNLHFTVIIPAIIILAVLHELLHAAGWMLNSDAGWKDIKFGVVWKLLTPYVHLRIPISAHGHRISIALPGIVLGIIPALSGIIFGSGVIAFIGAVMTGASGGDLIVFWMMRSIPPSKMVQDHPTKAGFTLIDDGK